MKKIIATIIFCFISAPSFSAELPSSGEVKKVLDFYFHGQGSGVVLIESKLCRDIHREGDEKNECSGNLSGEMINKGDAIYLWMAFMAPTGDEKQKIIVQFDHGGITRTVKNLEISGSLRFRTWRKVSFDRAGAWSAKIVHDKLEGAQQLGSASFNVQ